MHYDFGFDKTPANYVPLTPLSFLKRSAAVYPHHVSAVYEDRSFTWAQTYERCRRFASYLASKGVVSGDTVAAMLPNVPAMNEAHFAVPMAGAVLNALNIRLDAPSIAFQLDHGGAKVILVDPEFSDVIAEALAQMKGPKPFVIDVDDTSFKDGRRIGQIEYEGAVTQGDPSFTEVRPEDEWNAIALSYTSGTTGNPKGVVTHHRGAYLNALSNILVGKLGQHPVYLWTLPMFHCNGWCFPWAVAALAGVNVHLRKVEPAKVFELIKLHCVTLALKWAVNDRLSVTPSVYYQQLHINDTGAYWANLSNASSDTFYNGNTLSDPSHDPFLLSSIRVDWNLGFAQLVSNTSYFWRNLSSSSNSTNYLQAVYAGAGLLPTIYPQPGDAAPAPAADQQRNFYQEIRLASSDPSARVSWSTGVFYSHLNENVTEFVYAPQLQQAILTYSTAQGQPYDLCAQPLPCPNGEIEYNPLNRIVDKQVAVFGEASAKLGDGFKATVGLRVSRDQYSGSAFEGGPFVGAVISQAASAAETPVTPKFGLSYEPDRDHLYYASIAKGYRVGGTNSPVASICDPSLAGLGLPNGQLPPTYRSDSLWSYELGAKTLFLDRRLQINASLFVIDWSNIQQSVYLPACGFAYTANTGKVQSRGGDIDVQFRPVDSLTLGLTAAYTDARFTESACAGTLQFGGAAAGCTGPTAPSGGVAPVVSEGDRLTGAPWTIMSSAEERLGDWNGHMPYVRVDYQFATAQTALPPYHDPRNSSYDATLPGYPRTSNLQLRAGFRWSGYDISLFAQNVLDQNPHLFVSRDVASPPNADNLYFVRGQRPRTVGLTATYRY
jgi:outer membrane receptor protein involved in Fe transport